MGKLLTIKKLLWFLLPALVCLLTNAESNPLNNEASAHLCNSITGLYNGGGEYLNIDSSKYAKPRMDWTLFLRECGGNATGVELTWNSLNSSLDVRIHGENLYPPERINYSIPASCADGEIIYSVDHEGRSEGGTHNKAYLNGRLFKDDAGNLIFEGQSYVESTDLFIFKRTSDTEFSARFYPLSKTLKGRKTRSENN